jgi:hypothetical protein
LPRWVALEESDNELPIDLHNVAAVDTFVELIKVRDHAVMIELFPGPDQLWAEGPEGRFVHEIIVPFIRAAKPRNAKETQAESRQAVPSPSRGAAGLERRFPPGSEWLYAKLYAGPATLDQVLSDVVRPVVESVMRAGAADRWFFSRYCDPHWHLRLRFHGEPVHLQQVVLPVLQAATAALLTDGRLWRLQFDTYEREVERYGGPQGIELAERFFQVDSEAVLALVTLTRGDARGACVGGWPYREWIYYSLIWTSTSTRVAASSVQPVSPLQKSL